MKTLETIQKTPKTKSELGYWIHRTDHWNALGVYPESFTKEEVKREFEKLKEIIEHKFFIKFI